MRAELRPAEGSHSAGALRASKRLALCAIAIAALCTARPAHAQKRLADYVNTLRGSNSSREFSRGATFPAVTLPFGFNFWTPFTEGNSQRALYVYGRKTLQGFGVSHEPSPAIRDHGSIQMMPEVGELKVTPAARAAAFRHSREIARPYYYSVDLESPAVRVEFTPTDHAARFRYTYPRSDHAILLFDSIDSITGEIRVLTESGEIEGAVDHNGPRLYFAAHVDAPIQSVEYPANSGVSAALRFDTRNTQVVNVSIGTSFISFAQARSNLAAEIGTRSFEELRETAARAWDAQLKLIEVEGANDNQLITLYSNLYRAFMYPNSMWERVGEEARYFSPYDAAVHVGKIWVNNGFWDTYRAAWPLYVLLFPAQAGDMLQGFVRAYLDGGWTPRWSGPGYRNSMVGSHADSALADAYLKGVRNFDVQAAYASMLKNALVAPADPAHGRKLNEVSIFTGYVPASALAGSLAWSLENCVNDYSISQLAAALGDSLHATYFRSRALGYVDMFSPSVHFFRGRNADGAWRSPDSEFRAHEWGYEYVEGNAWHYSMAANHDPEGMARLYGGRAALSAKIDAMIAAPRDFLRGSYPRVSHEMAEAYATNFGQYAHANEPAHHILYMYNYAGTPWKTQAAVREVMSESRGIYGPGIGDGGGYLGDEDNGQMSAWFIFSALGFYPASPGHTEYAIGSPLFKRAIIHVPGDKPFIVSAPANSDANRYIQSARLNGQPLSRNYLKHTEIAAGGELVLELGPTPSQWGSQPGDVPSSLSLPGQTLPRLRDHTRGGVVRASGAAHRNFPPSAGFDDDSRTEWRPGAPSAWLETHFAEGGAYAARYYTLTSGSKSPPGDPRAWTLMTSQDGEHWTTLDVRRDEKFEWRQQTRVFEIKAPQKAAYYRLLIEGTAGDAAVQLAEVELLSEP